jgi:plasmid maintenance system antidote protein VapI
MEIFQKILTKDEIQSRFIRAVYALLKEDKSLTKTSLAESFNVKPAKFSEILNDRMKAGVDMIAILCDFWNVSPDWILMSRGPIFRDESEKQPIWVQENLETTPPYSKSDKTVTKETGTKDEQTPIITQLLDTIKEQAEEIGRLKARNEELERRRGDNAGHAQSSDIANVG